MTDKEYLEKILLAQNLGDDSDEMVELRKRRKEVETRITEEFGSGPRIRSAGSMAKGTMNRESYDLDMTCYFPHNDDGAGETLKEIYTSVETALKKTYHTRRKGCAVRVLDASNDADFHIDVVPGRFVDGEAGDVFLYPSSTDKERLKTNLQTHVDHVKDSGLIEAIRLLKLWKVRRALDVKTFALELLAIDLLEGKTRKSLPEQLKHVWLELKEQSDDLQIKDPANPDGNDLSALLTLAIREQLASHAAATLELIDREGWEAVFGPIDDEEDDPQGRSRLDALRTVAASSPVPVKPWRAQ